MNNFKIFTFICLLFLTACVNDFSRETSRAYVYPPQQGEVDEKATEKRNQGESNSTDVQKSSSASAEKAGAKLTQYDNKESCKFSAGRHEGGEYMPSYYSCPDRSVYASKSINNCHFVKGYIKNDGVEVKSHYRCKYAIKPSEYISSYKAGRGTTYVRGYYRKDGTYVRPHTRRPRR